MKFTIAVFLYPALKIAELFPRLSMVKLVESGPDRMNCPMVAAGPVSSSSVAVTSIINAPMRLFSSSFL